MCNLKENDPTVYLSSPVSGKDKDVAGVYINSSTVKSSCKRVRKPSSMLSKERAISNKRQREKDSIYNTTLSAALFRHENSTKIRLKGKSVEICRVIVDDFNNTLLAHCEKELTKTTLERYAKRVGQEKLEQTLIP